MKEVDLLIRASWLVPITTAPLKDAWLAIDEGRIVAIGQGEAPATKKTHDYGDAAVMPGLINAHTHLGCSFLRAEQDDLLFMDWFSSSIVPRVQKTVAEDGELLRSAALQAGRELVAGGVTTVVDSFFDSVGWTVLEELGLRGFFCREFFGSMAEDLEAYESQFRQKFLRDLKRFSQNKKLSYGLAPHALYSCPTQILKAVVAKARQHELLTTIHLDESHEEHECFRHSKGPLFESFLNSGRPNRFDLQMTPTEVLNHHDLLKPQTLLVHAVHLTESDIVKVSESGASIVLCPASNARLGVGVAPMGKYLAAGINLAIGTDSPASNGKLDMFEEMRLLVAMDRNVARTQPPVSASALLYMATTGGAKACGLSAKIGSLEPSKLADLAVLNLSSPRHQGISDPYSSIVNSAIVSDVVATYVEGQVIGSVA